MRSTVCSLLVLAGIAAAQPRLAFEAASVKPNVTGSNSSSTHGSKGQIIFTNVSLRMLLVNAFEVRSFQVIGPAWLEAVRFDISAKLPAGAEELKRSDRAAMLRNLLEERFGLAFHKETKDISGYALVIAKGGFKLKPVKDTENHGTNSNSDGKIVTVTATQMSMESLAANLANRLATAVVDRTGIAGVYDFVLKWNVDDQAAAADANAPATLFTALQETLGLRLQGQKVPVEMVVIDKIERTATEN